MNAKEIVQNHDAKIKRLKRAISEMNDRLMTVEAAREALDLDFDIELSPEVSAVNPPEPEPDNRAADQGGAELGADTPKHGGGGDGHEDRQVGSPGSPQGQTPDSADAVPGSAEPEVSMRIGGSTEEQKAAYKAFVEARNRAVAEQRGLVEEGDERVIARATKKQLLLRRQLAEEIGWEHWTRSEEYDSEPLEETAAKVAYEKGGPIWLVHYDRDFVKQQTMATRQKMVADVMLTDTVAANELSADILKYEDSNDPSVATDNAEAAWDAA